MANITCVESQVYPIRYVVQVVETMHEKFTVYIGPVLFYTSILLQTLDSARPCGRELSRRVRRYMTHVVCSDCQLGHVVWDTYIAVSDDLFPTALPETTPSPEQGFALRKVT